MSLHDDTVEGKSGAPVMSLTRPLSGNEKKAAENPVFGPLNQRCPRLMPIANPGKLQVPLKICYASQNVFNLLDYTPF